MPNALLFDFDGTIIDSNPFIYQRFGQVASEMGLRAPERKDFQKIIGLPWDVVLNNLWAGVDIAEFTKRYNEVRECLPAFPGAVEAVEQLASIMKLGIVTSRKRSTLTKRMEDIDLDSNLFDIILTKDEIPFYKPDPRVLRYACESLTMIESEVWYTGDSINDAKCAQDAKVDFIAVLSGGTPASEFEPYEPKWIIDSIANIADRVKQSR